MEIFRRSKNTFLQGLLFAGLLWALATPASATVETLQRSVSNMVCAPFDLVLAPASALYSTVDNMRNIDDTRGVRVAYALPAVAWNTGMVVGIAVLRAVYGLLEFLPGLGLVVSENDIDPLFAPVENSEALFDVETPVIPIRLGLLYTA